MTCGRTVIPFSLPASTRHVCSSQGRPLPKVRVYQKRPRARHRRQRPICGRHATAAGAQRHLARTWRGENAKKGGEEYLAGSALPLPPPLRGSNNNTAAELRRRRDVTSRLALLCAELSFMPALLSCSFASAIVNVLCLPPFPFQTHRSRSSLRASFIHVALHLLLFFSPARPHGVVKARAVFTAIMPAHNCLAPAEMLRSCDAESHTRGFSPRTWRPASCGGAAERPGNDDWNREGLLTFHHARRVTAHGVRLGRRRLSRDKSERCAPGCSTSGRLFTLEPRQNWALEGDRRDP